MSHWPLLEEGQCPTSRSTNSGKGWPTGSQRVTTTLRYFLGFGTLNTNLNRCCTQEGGRRDGICCGNPRLPHFEVWPLWGGVGISRLNGTAVAECAARTSCPGRKGLPGQSPAYSFVCPSRWEPQLSLPSLLTSMHFYICWVDTPISSRASAGSSLGPRSRVSWTSGPCICSQRAETHSLEGGLSCAGLAHGN